MSKMFDYVSGQTGGKIAELEAREEYAIGHLEAQMKENNELRDALSELVLRHDIGDGGDSGSIERAWETARLLCR